MKLILIIVLVLVLSGCSAEEMKLEKDIYEYTEICEVTKTDIKTTSDNPTKVVFDKDNQLYIIDEAGDYYLSGEYEGNIQIDVEDKIVHLILDNVEMQSINGPVIYVKSASKVVITVPEGTKSILKDSTDYMGYEDTPSCIFSQDNLTINGEGNLQVYGYYKDAIRTKDVLRILNVTMDVSSKGVGLRGNDGVMAKNANLNIQCEGTGIYTEKENKENKGFVDLYGGTIRIVSGKYGIDCAQNVYIFECIGEIFGTAKDIICSGEEYIEEGCLE